MVFIQYPPSCKVQSWKQVQLCFLHLLCMVQLVLQHPTHRHQYMADATGICTYTRCWVFTSSPKSSSLVGEHRTHHAFDTLPCAFCRVLLSSPSRSPFMNLLKLKKALGPRGGVGGGGDVPVEPPLRGVGCLCPEQPCWARCTGAFLLLSTPPTFLCHTVWPIHTP